VQSTVDLMRVEASEIIIYQQYEIYLIAHMIQAIGYELSRRILFVGIFIYVLPDHWLVNLNGGICSKSHPDFRLKA